MEDCLGSVEISLGDGCFNWEWEIVLRKWSVREHVLNGMKTLKSCGTGLQGLGDFLAWTRKQLFIGIYTEAALGSKSVQFSLKMRLRMLQWLFWRFRMNLLNVEVVIICERVRDSWPRKPIGWRNGARFRSPQRLVLLPSRLHLSLFSYYYQKGDHLPDLSSQCH